MGGATYNKELSAVRSIIGLLAELERRGKIVRRANAEVDAEESKVRQIEPSKDFDDPHLVALVRLTGCKLICIRDLRAHRFLRAAHFYRRLQDRPRLYTRAKNSPLLCAANIAPCCK
jgi:hypothetical protein